MTMWPEYDHNQLINNNKSDRLVDILSVIKVELQKYNIDNIIYTLNYILQNCPNFRDHDEVCTCALVSNILDKYQLILYDDVIDLCTLNFENNEEWISFIQINDQNECRYWKNPTDTILIDRYINTNYRQILKIINEDQYFKHLREEVETLKLQYTLHSI